MESSTTTVIVEVGLVPLDLMTPGVLDVWGIFELVVMLLERRAGSRVHIECLGPVKAGRPFGLDCIFFVLVRCSGFLKDTDKVLALY